MKRRGVKGLIRGRQSGLVGAPVVTLAVVVALAGGLASADWYDSDDSAGTLDLVATGSTSITIDTDAMTIVDNLANTWNGNFDASVCVFQFDFVNVPRDFNQLFELLTEPFQGTRFFAPA